MKKLITLLTLASSLTASAEFGVSAGASFNYKATFQTRAETQGFANDAGADAAGENHEYDDGYNRVDSMGNWDRGTGSSRTTYWGYQNDSQHDPVNRTITMNSSQNILDANSFSGEQSEGQPALEMYWQKELTENEKWNLGLRVALRWQRIEMDSSAMASTTIETISDTYGYDPTLNFPPAGFNGSSQGPNQMIYDDPDRNITYAPGANIFVTRNLEADLFAFDFGPTLSLNLTEKLRLTASVGGTIAWVHSEFSYEDGAFARGRDTKEDCLFGAYAGADLNYLIGERWGIFGGAAYTRLEDFEQEVDGRSAELQFDDSYTIRAGIFFQ